MSGAQHSGEQGAASFREIPWDDLEAQLKAWLASLQQAMAKQNPGKVLSLMQGLVAFMASNHGVFMESLMSSNRLDASLHALGAPRTFVRTFTDIVHMMTGQGARIITFGAAPGLYAHDLAALLRRFSAALSSRSPSPSPTRLSRENSPRALPDAAPAPPPARFSRAVEEELRNLTLAVRGAGDVEAVRSVQLSRVTNAVAVAAASLPPEVVRGLAELEATPFLFFRQLSLCFIEVLFCIYSADVTYVLDRRLIYIGPRNGTQLEGPLALEFPESAHLIMGAEALPWRHAVCLLGARESGDERDDSSDASWDRCEDAVAARQQRGSECGAQDGAARASGGADLDAPRHVDSSA